MKKLLSPGAVARRLMATVRRFPLAVACVAVMAAFAFVLNLHNFIVEIDYRLWVALPIALFASVALTLALEDRLPWWTTQLAALGVAALWGVRCLFFPDDAHDLTTPQWVEIGVIGGAAFFAIFFAPFLGRNSDAQQWNFTMRTLVRLVLGGIFAGILNGGLALAIFAVEELFRADIPYELYRDVSIVCWMIFAPLYVLAGVPSGEAKRDGELHPVQVLKVLGLYILGSILAIYVLILYVYLLKIVFTWELPNGWVSWLVTVLGAGGLVVTILLYPLRMKGGNRVVEFLARWMGVIIAPLLVLMTVGIARRVLDYGWTPNRCYILLLNLWLYGIYIWLAVVRARRVKWILVSAVAVAVLSSVGPWSLAGVTPREDVERRGGAEGIEAAEEADYGRAFHSDSTITVNTPQFLGRGYDKFAKIYWHDSGSPKGVLEITEQEGDLVIRIPEEGREFRVPVQQAAHEAVIRGDGFVFLVFSLNGEQYEREENIRVTFVNGCLFYN